MSLPAMQTDLGLAADIEEQVEAQDPPVRAVKVAIDKRRPRWVLQETLPQSASLADDFQGVLALLQMSEPCALLVRVKDSAWVIVVWTPEGPAAKEKQQYQNGAAAFQNHLSPTLQLGVLHASAWHEVTWAAFSQKGREVAEDAHFFQNGKAVEAFRMGEESALALHSWSSMLGPTLETADGLRPTDEVLAGKRQVALFFAASYCPWCRVFMPYLEDVISKVKAADPNDTEVVFISTDLDADGFTASTKGKPWLSMPFERSQGTEEAEPAGFLSRKVREKRGKPQGALGVQYGIELIPTVLMLDGKTGDVLNKDFLKDVGSTPAEGMAFTDKAPPSWLRVL